MINEVSEKRWELSIPGNERGTPVKVVTVNSIDGDPKSAKVTVMAGQQIVSVADLIDLLKRVASNTTGIPSANDEESPLPLSVIPNYMGINLCSVDSISWVRQDDGQLVSLTIHFIPATEEQKRDPGLRRIISTGRRSSRTGDGR